MSMFKIFCIIAAIFFLLPFFAWQYVRWEHKVRQNHRSWHKPLMISVWTSCLALCLLFVILAFVFYNS